jgi:hypothetical protein
MYRNSEFRRFFGSEFRFRLSASEFRQLALGKMARRQAPTEQILTIFVKLSPKISLASPAAGLFNGLAVIYAPSYKTSSKTSI